MRTPLFLNLGRNHNGDFNRIKKLVDLGGDKCDGYILPLYFAPNYRLKMPNMPKLEELVAFFSEHNKALVPIVDGHTDIHAFPDKTHIGINSFNWNNSELLHEITKKTQNVYAYTTGLDETQIAKLYQFWDRIVLIHENGGNNVSYENANVKHLMTLAKLQMSIDCPPLIAYSSKFPQAPEILLSALVYSPVFVSCYFDDGNGMDNNISVLPKELDELLAKKEIVETAMDCGCFAPLPDVQWVSNVLK